MGVARGLRVRGPGTIDVRVFYMIIYGDVL